MPKSSVSGSLDKLFAALDPTHVSLDTSIMANLIEVIRGDAGLHCGSRYVEDFSS